MIFFIILELIILVISSPPFLIHYRKVCRRAEPLPGGKLFIPSEHPDAAETTPEDSEMPSVR